MPNFLADTSFLIDVINDRNGRREFLSDLLQPGCYTINSIEIYSGMRPGEERDIINDALPPGAISQTRKVRAVARRKK
jgi:hypothetical protein